MPIAFRRLFPRAAAFNGEKAKAALHATVARSLIPGRTALPNSTATFATIAPLRPPTATAATQRWSGTIQARCLTQSAARKHGHLTPPSLGEELNITFVDKDGIEHKFVVAEGDNLLDIAQANDLEMEGACGGSCACSTCHVIVSDEKYYNKMPEPNDDENDMLDLAFGLTETSRLGCQVKMTKELDGLVVKLPSMTRNLQAGDFK